MLSSLTRKPTIVLSLLFLCVLSGPPAFRGRDPTATLRAELDWSILLNVLVWAVAGTWVIYRLFLDVLIKRTQRFEMEHLRILFFAFCLGLSAFLSPVPQLTLYRVLQIVLMGMFGYIWVARYGLHTTFRHLYWSYTSFVALIAILAFVEPGAVYYDSRLRGGPLGEVGPVAVMGLVLGISYPVVRRSWTRNLLHMLHLGVVLASRTRADLTAVIFVLMLAVLRAPKIGEARRYALAVVGTLPIWLLAGWLPNVLDFVLRGSPTQIKSFSGRIPLWIELIEQTVKQSPLFGLGFAATRADVMAIRPEFGSEHSSYVLIFVGAGIIGALGFAIVLVPVLWKSVHMYVHCGTRAEVFTSVSLLACTLLTGVTTPLIAITSPAAFTFWVLTSIIPILWRDTRRSSPATLQSL